jgi:hypothetical protein
MRFTAFDYSMWIAGAVLHLTIVTVMARRNLIRELPLFFAFVVCSLASSVSVFVALQVAGYAGYFYTFWIAQGLLNLLIFAVMYEVYRHVFKNYQALQRLGTLLFWWTGSVLLLVAVVTAASSPGSDASRLMTGLITIERSVRVIQVGLLLFILLFTSHFKLSWRHCVFGLAFGLGVYAAFQLIAVSLRAHIGESANAVWGKLSVMAYVAGAIVWTRYLSIADSTVVQLQGPQKAELEKWNQALLQLLYR